MEMVENTSMDMDHNNKKAKSKRIPFYDVLKGFAIFIVAFEHCILTLNPSIKSSYISNAIQLIQMPLFIGISGFFFYSSLKKYSFAEIIRKKFNHLYLPSLCWGIIGTGVIFCFKIVAGKELVLSYFISSVFTGMWFLTALFILSTIGAVLYFFMRKYFFLIWCLIFGIIYFIENVWMINEIKFLLPFFVIAIFFRNTNLQKLPFWLFLISAILYIGSIKIYNWDFTLYSMGKSNIYSWEYLYMTGVRIIGGLSGIICSIFLCKYISQISRLNDILCYIGKMTLPIYVIHQKFLLLPKILKYHTDNWSMIFASTILILGLSILLYKLMKYRIIRKYLFGEI